MSSKTLVGTKPLRMWINKINSFIRVYDGKRFLVLFGLEKYVAIYNRVKYLISDITYVFFSILCNKQS